MNDNNKVNPNEIRELFGSISNTYDIANDVITLGMAHNWRRKLVDFSEARSGQRVLDCASGTGDLALEFKKEMGPESEVVATDFCKEMLEHGPEKARQANLDIKFEVADVMQLPYTDRSFNIVSIAYGIRNVKDPGKAISEMARVTKKDGCVVILETGQVETPLFGQAIQAYFKYVVPRLGGWVSGNRNAYEYLNSSSMAFPCKEDFLQLMESTKRFKKLEYKTLMGGASYIYKGTVC